MSHRTLTTRVLRFHRSRRPEESVSASSIGGSNLTEIFEQWLDQLDARQLWDIDSNLVCDLESVRRVGPDMLLLTFDAGKHGEPGRMFNINSGEGPEIHRDDATTARVRVLVVVPRGADYGLLFSEKSYRGQAGTRVTNQFNSWFSKNFKVTMTPKFVTLGEDWIAAAELKGIKVIARVSSDEIAGAPSDSFGVVTHAIELKGHDRFVQGIKDLIRKRPERAARYVYLSDIPENSEVQLTLDDGSVRKTITVGHDDDGAIAYDQLTRDGQDELTDDMFVDYCSERVEELRHRLG